VIDLRARSNERSAHDGCTGFAEYRHAESTFLQACVLHNSRIPHQNLGQTIPGDRAVRSEAKRNPSSDLKRWRVTLEPVIGPRVARTRWAQARCPIGSTNLDPGYALQSRREPDGAAPAAMLQSYKSRDNEMVPLICPTRLSKYSARPRTCRRLLPYAEGAVLMIVFFGSRSLRREMNF
jgi:hypothetical protein